MIRHFFASSCALVALLLVVASGGAARGQTAYGVNSLGILFRFDVTSPATVTTIGLVGFVPEGIDFRPGTSQLYGIEIGPQFTQVYAINPNTAAATPVGNGFASAGSVNGVAYDLTGNNSYGFDFNPKTVMGDGSMLIRLIATNETNLRINSTSGQIVSVDTALSIQPGSNAPFSDAAAYINNLPNGAGATTLYTMDIRNNALYLLNNPNTGQMTKVGDFGATIGNVQRGIGFDIVTDPSSVDDTIGGDRGYAVLKRPDAPINGPLGAYLLYQVNLGTGAISNGALVGTGQDFDGGFSIRQVPEPASVALAIVGACALLVRVRRPEA